MLTCGSPQLIAAYRVLLRHSVPWHPPCALVRLILPVHVEHYFLRLLRVVFNKDCLLFVSSLCSFQGALKFLSAFLFPTFRSSVSFCFRPLLSIQLSVSIRFRSFKTIQKSIILLSDSVDLLANFIDTLCRCCLFCKRLCRFFRLPATDVTQLST